MSFDLPYLELFRPKVGKILWMSWHRVYPNAYGISELLEITANIQHNWAGLNWRDYDEYRKWKHYIKPSVAFLRLKTLSAKAQVALYQLFLEKYIMFTNSNTTTKKKKKKNKHKKTQKISQRGDVLC